ncbi:DNA polymerase III subunit delta' [Liquorilactobacillus oeni]|uniref:DNA polymerase III subunit delta n=1 Tax=Liquorilactobacillus oeni DSM 19972 TaxID=1423777 RepID=A0A0R1M9Q7_9LACO|nr:DNA polymerase III subunit delta' [Liquorilactobacillus oeni]KRL04862.1 DNA polymerase III subunit delta [Liquorilactobacillus oeni DSM 19972]
MNSITEKGLQPQLNDYFAKMINSQKLAHAYIFAGPEGSGKKELATWIAQGIYCENCVAGHPCQKCAECIRIASGNQPDVVHVAPEGLSIKVDQIRFLKDEFSKSGVESNRKVFIIENAEKMTSSAANSLLKFLEEPSGQVIAFLLTEKPNSLLPTIISRCQLFELRPLSDKQLLFLLEKEGIPEEKAVLLSRLTDSPTLARKLAENNDFEKLSVNVCQWYLHILQNDWLCFVEVQTKLLTYISNKEDEKIVFDLLLLLGKNSLELRSGGEDQSAFKKYQSQLKEQLDKLSIDKVSAGTELFLESLHLLQINISFQNTIEALTLKLCRCYHG